MNILFKITLLILSYALIGHGQDSCLPGQCVSHTAIVASTTTASHTTPYATPYTPSLLAQSSVLASELPLERPLELPSEQTSAAGETAHRPFLSLASALFHRHNTSTDTEDGIEGTGNHDSHQGFSESPSFAEGGIEGTGLSGDDSNSDGDTDGIEGTGILAGADTQLITYGPITQFGSIYVNGTKYETDDADITFAHGDEHAELQLGMMVQVHTDWLHQDHGVLSARSVLFDKQLEGPIESITSTGDSQVLTLLGSTVIVDSDTVIHNHAGHPLTVGTVVTVSGLANDKDQQLATYLAVHSQSYDESQLVEFEATIQAVDLAEQQLTINGMSVDVSQAEWQQGSLDTMQVGDRVEVIGQYHRHRVAVTAQHIRVKHQTLKVSNGNRLDLDTFITHYQSRGQFQLNGIPSDASDAHIVVGDATDLRDGTRIRAVGAINNQGTFVIRAIRVKEKSKSALKAPVTAVDTLRGEITLLGITGIVSADTSYASSLDSDNKYISLHDIHVGDWVEIKGKVKANGLLIQQVNKIAPKPTVILKGPLAKAHDGQLSIADVRILYDTVFSAEQVSALTHGSVAQVKGEYVDHQTVQASDITLMKQR